jgi:hypothetical protein
MGWMISAGWTIPSGIRFGASPLRGKLETPHSGRLRHDAHAKLNYSKIA